MEHLNFVHIRGNVGSVQLVPYGEKKQAALSVATNYGYMDKDGIALIETTWFHVTAIEGVAAPLDTLQRIERGSAVEVKGRFRAKRYVNSTGEEKISYQVVASELNLIGDNNLRIVPQKAESLRKQRSDYGKTQTRRPIHDVKDI